VELRRAPDGHSEGEASVRVGSQSGRAVVEAGVEEEEVPTEHRLVQPRRVDCVDVPPDVEVERRVDELQLDLAGVDDRARIGERRRGLEQAEDRGDSPRESHPGSS